MNFRKYADEIAQLQTAWQLLLQELDAGTDRRVAIDRLIDTEVQIQDSIEARLAPDELIRSQENPGMEDLLGTVFIYTSIAMGVKEQMAENFPNHNIPALAKEVHARALERAHHDNRKAGQTAETLLAKLGIRGNPDGRKI